MADSKSQLLDDKSRLVRLLKGCRAGPVRRSASLYLHADSPGVDRCRFAAYQSS